LPSDCLRRLERGIICAASTNSSCTIAYRTAVVVYRQHHLEILLTNTLDPLFEQLPDDPGQRLLADRCPRCNLRMCRKGPDQDWRWRPSSSPRLARVIRNLLYALPHVFFHMIEAQLNKSHPTWAFVSSQPGKVVSHEHEKLLLGSPRSSSRVGPVLDVGFFR